MKKSLENALEKVIPKYLGIFKSTSRLGGRLISKIKKDIRKELPDPNVSIYKKDIAKYILIYHYKEGTINNKEEFNQFYSTIGFIINNLEKAELGALADSLFSEENEENEDDLLFYNQEHAQNYYLNDDPDWFLELGLKENPFPSQDGLFLISRNKIEDVVLKTQIYNKYIEALEQDSKWILNRSVVIYGDFGCGKTTFFDYLEYTLLLKDIFPIRIILNAQASLYSIRQKFNEALFHELAQDISNFAIDPRGNIENINNYSILTLFEKIQQEKNKIGYVIFLDGLHKSEDQKSTALNFLIELQNILEFYRRKNINLTIFVAGSLEWRDKIKNNNKFSGSIFTLEKMDPLNVSQAYEMLKRRFNVYSDTKERDYIKYGEVELLVTSIERALATDVTFRILIKYFLQNGFIFKDRIKIKPFIEEDVLNNIFEAIKNNKFLYNNLVQMKNEFLEDKTQFSNILYVISTTYDMGYFFENSRYYQKNLSSFEYLQEKNIITRSNKYKKNNEKPYALNLIIHETFKDIENKVKFRPTHYFQLLFEKEQLPVRIEAEYLGILTTIKRYKENNPEYEEQFEHIIQLTQEQYFKLIRTVEEKLDFQISGEIILQMKNIVENLLHFIYEISGEPLKNPSQTQLFKIFRYTWLDNRILTQFFNWVEGWNANINDTRKNKHFLKQFIDTFESLINKVGKHVLYNKILIVGSKELNNQDKITLNEARAFFSGKQYKESINTYHDLMESKLREFIFNILYLKYENSWEEFLPKKSINYILKIKRKEKKKFGKQLLKSTNSLYYLSRGAYSNIINDNYLWESCFAPLFGDAYRSAIRESLETLASLGNLDKHNREKEEFGQLAPLIQQLLPKIKMICEIINIAYRNILELRGLIIKDMEIVPRFHSQEKIDKLKPLSFNKEEVKRVLEIFKKSDKMENKSEQYYSLSNINSIRETFSLSYRTFIGCLIILFYDKKIDIEDYQGSKVIFELLNYN